MMVFKSKERKEIERRIRIKKAKTMVQNYIYKLEKLQKRIFNQGKEFAKLGDEKMVRNQVTKYLAIESRLKQAKKLLLLMEEADIQRELAKLSNTFIQFSKDVINSIAEAPNIKDITKAQVKFEEAMAKVEGIEDALDTVIDAASESILSGSEFSEDKIEEVSKLLMEETKVEEEEVDSKIEQKLREIEEMMKNDKTK